MQQYARNLLSLFLAGATLVTSPLWAQPAVQLPSANPSAYSAAGAAAPGTGLAAPATSGLGTPMFDPYATAPGGGFSSPSFGSAVPSYGAPLPPSSTPPPGAMSPYSAAPGGAFGAPPASPYGQPYGGYGPGAVPGNTPPSLFPNGWTTTNNWGLPATRFLTPRLRHTYVHGGNGAYDLGMNDTDASVVAAFPNFLYSTQPLYVSPSFSLHLWDGPQSPVGDLPGSAYSAFLDAGWSSDPAQPFGGEVGTRVGVFTDFETFNTQSIRIMGQGLFRIRTTPTTTLRGGVIYLDRNRFKLFPAFGLLWTPNSQTRFDIFFPRPKLAQHLTTMGNHDLWWYVGGEYGGGAWTIGREAGGVSFNDSVDINDIRLIVGVEWGQSALLQEGRRTGFFEAGWVTDREIIYVTTPNQDVSLSDSFMLRLGWNY